MKLRAFAFDLAIGLIAAAAALTLRWSLDHLLGASYPFATGFVIVALTAWYFGWRAAVVMMAVFYPGGIYFFVEPRGELSVAMGPDAIGLLLNTLSASLLALLGDKARQAREGVARTNRALEAANQELAENAKRKDEFMATLSHELRNPLSAIVTAAHMLERVALSDGRAANAVRVITRQTRQMKGLLEDLLDMSRVSMSRLELNPIDTDVRTCIDDALQGHCEAIAKKQHVLSLDIPSTPVRVKVDALRFTQIMTNLIGNAVRHSQEHTKIRVSLVVKSAGILISVKDTGPGIEAARLPHIFDPLHAGHLLRKSGDGLGIGLPLTKSLVELHGGSITVVSAGINQGCEFIISLPAANDQSLYASPDPQPNLGCSETPLTLNDMSKLIPASAANCALPGLVRASPVMEAAANRSRAAVTHGAG